MFHILPVLRDVSSLYHFTRWLQPLCIHRLILGERMLAAVSVLAFNCNATNSNSVR